MKKSLLLLSAMLSCSLAFAQGAEGEESDRLLFIPRIEANPYAPFGNSRFDGGKIDLGNSSLYTLFEGDFGGSNFFYSMEGHWLSSDPASLYQNAFHSQESTFIDWAYLGYSFGDFSISAGKQMLALGSFEMDDYDYDAYSAMNSTFWNNLQVYQFGATLDYTNPSDGSLYELQFATSPFGNRPFSGTASAPALYAWSFRWTGEYGWYSPIWSYNALQTYDWNILGEEAGRGPLTHVLALGNKFTMGDFDLVLDYTNRFWGGESFFSEGSLNASLAYNLDDTFMFKVKAGYDFNRTGDDVFGYIDDAPLESFVPTSLALLDSFGMNGYVYGGVLAEWYPLDNLRVHANLTANNWAQAAAFNVGLTYYFDALNFRSR